jgi:NADH dehydrogenase [ubiquinone] 1 alpha subcomplex assembly factor 6
MTRPIQRYHLKQIIDARVRPNISPGTPSSHCNQVNALQGPRAHATLQAHIDAQAPLQNALLLGPLPLVLPPTHPATSDISHTLTHISSLLSTTSLLRSLPLNTSKRINTLPRDVCVAHGLVEEDLFRNGAGAKGLQDACFQVGTRGMDELITARSHLKSGKVDPKAATPVFLSTVSLSGRVRCNIELILGDRFRRRGISNGWRRWTLTLFIRTCKKRIGSSRP